MEVTINSLSRNPDRILLPRPDTTSLRLLLKPPGVGLLLRWCVGKIEILY